jgi:chitodextrinase
MSSVSSTCSVPTGVRRRASWLVAALLAVLLSMQVGLAEPASAASPITYAGSTYPTAGPSPTGDKPQSKLWYNDGSWWALMRVTAGVTIHRLGTDHKWVNTGVVVDERIASTGDALWQNGNLYVASRVSSGAMRAIRFAYNASTDTYTREFVKQVGSNGTESMSIARDSLGRLWVAYTQGSRVYAAHSTTSDTTWTPPFLIPVSDNTATSDDIAGLIAFNGKIGVMWSDQGQDVMRFAVHQDSDSDSTWTLESALPNPSLGGANLADDHLNLKSLTEGSDGTIFAAVKTSRGDAGEPSTDPSIVVLKRSATGTWSGAVAARVGDKLTRPQLALDNMGKLHVLMSTESGGTVYYKTTSQASLSFGTGKGAPFVAASGASINDATTTKQTVTAATGLVVLASDDDAKRYYHGELALGSTTDTTAPTAPTNVNGTATANSVALTWTAATDNVGVTGYRILRNGTQVGTSTTTSFTDTGLAASTAYSYTVTAVDAAGNVSAPSAAKSVTTLSGSEPPPASGVSFVGAATATSATTSVSVAAPAGVQAGDVLVAAVSVRGSTTITAPSGWTRVRLDAQGTTMVQGIYTKVASGSDASAWTVSRAYGTVVQVLAYRGVDTTAPVVASGAALSTTTTITSPSVASVANSRVVTIAGIARTATLAPASPLTERSEITTTASATYKVTADAADTTTAGTTSGAFTTIANGSAGGIGQTVTLRPRA